MILAFPHPAAALRFTVEVQVCWQSEGRGKLAYSMMTDERMYANSVHPDYGLAPDRCDPHYCSMLHLCAVVPP